MQYWNKNLIGINKIMSVHVFEGHEEYYHRGYGKSRRNCMIKTHNININI